MNGGEDRKNQSCRDRSMSVNTDASKESMMSSANSMGSIAGSNLTMDQRKQRVIQYWEKKK
jgi:hypothetical protein